VFDKTVHILNTMVLTDAIEKMIMRMYKLMAQILFSLRLTQIHLENLQVIT